MKWLDKYDYVLFDWSLPPRGAWIEIQVSRSEDNHTPSLPPRGAWIEIQQADRKLTLEPVAPPTGSVD